MGNYLNFAPHIITPDKNVMIFGLPQSGKTSLLYWLKLGEQIFTFPTLGVNHEDICFGTTKARCMDFGQCEYESYKDAANAIIYVVGTDDFALVKKHFEKIIADVPILVLVNKQDLEEAHTHVETMNALDLWKLENQFQCIPVMIRDGIGIQATHDWLTKYLI